MIDVACIVPALEADEDAPDCSQSMRPVRLNRLTPGTAHIPHIFRRVCLFLLILLTLLRRVTLSLSLL